MSIKKSIVNCVEVIEDAETGHTTFKPVEEKNQEAEENLTWLGRVAKWLSKSWIKLYVKCRDFNNGPDTNGENQCKPGVEVGVKVEF